MKTSRQRFTEWLNAQEGGPPAAPSQAAAPADGDEGALSILRKASEQIRAGRTAPAPVQAPVPELDVEPEPEPEPIPEPEPPAPVVPPAPPVPTKPAFSKYDPAAEWVPDEVKNARLPMTPREQAFQGRPSEKLLPRQQEAERIQRATQEGTTLPLREMLKLAAGKPEEEIQKQGNLGAATSRLAKIGANLAEVPGEMGAGVADAIRMHQTPELLYDIGVNAPIEAVKTSFDLGQAGMNSAINLPGWAKSLATGKPQEDVAGDPERYTQGLAQFLTNRPKELVNMLLAPAGAKMLDQGIAGIRKMGKSTPKAGPLTPEVVDTLPPEVPSERLQLPAPDPARPVPDAFIGDQAKLRRMLDIEDAQVAPEPPAETLRLPAPDSPDTSLPRRNAALQDLLGNKPISRLEIPQGQLLLPEPPPPMDTSLPLRASALQDLLGNKPRSPIEMVEEALDLPTAEKPLALPTGEVKLPSAEELPPPAPSTGRMSMDRPQMKLPEPTMEPAPESQPAALTKKEIAALPLEKIQLLKTIRKALTQEALRTGKPASLDAVADLVHADVFNPKTGKPSVPVEEWPDLYNSTLPALQEKFPHVYADRTIKELDLDAPMRAELDTDVPTPAETQATLDAAPETARWALTKVAEQSPKALADMERARIEFARDPELSGGDMRRTSGLMAMLKKAGLDDIAAKVEAAMPEGAEKTAGKDIMEALDANYKEAPEVLDGLMGPKTDSMAPEWLKRAEKAKREARAAENAKLDAENAKLDAEDAELDAKILGAQEATQPAMPKKKGRPVSAESMKKKLLEARRAFDVAKEAGDQQAMEGKPPAPEKQAPWDRQADLDQKAMLQKAKQINSGKTKAQILEEIANEWLRKDGADDLVEMNAGSKDVGEQVKNLGRAGRDLWNEFEASRVATNPKLNAGINLPVEIGRTNAADAVSKAKTGLIDTNRWLGWLLDKGMEKAPNFVRPIQSFINKRNPTGAIRGLTEAPDYLQKSLGEVMETHKWDPKTKSFVPTDERSPIAAEGFSHGERKFEAGDSLIGLGLDEIDPMYLKMRRYPRDPNQVAQSMRLLDEAKAKYGKGADQLVERMAERHEELREITRKQHLEGLREQGLKHAEAALAKRTTATDPKLGPKARADLLEEARVEQMRADNLLDADAQSIDSYMSRVPVGDAPGDPGYLGAWRGGNAANIRPGAEGKYRSGKAIVADIQPDQTYVGGPEKTPDGNRPNIQRTIDAMGDYISKGQAKKGQKASVSLVKEAAVDMHVDRWKQAQADGVDSGLRIVEPDNPAGREPVTLEEAKKAAEERTFSPLDKDAIDHGYGRTNYEAIQLADGTRVLVESDIARDLIRTKAAKPPVPVSDTTGAGTGRVQELVSDMSRAADSSLLADPAQYTKNAGDNLLRTLLNALQTGAEEGVRTGNRHGSLLEGAAEGLKTTGGSLKDIVSEISNRTLRDNGGDLSRFNLGGGDGGFLDRILENVPLVGEHLRDAKRGVTDFSRMVLSGDQTFTNANTRMGLRTARGKLIDKYIGEGMSLEDATREAGLDVQQAEVLRSAKTKTMPPAKSIRPGAMEAVTYAESAAAERLPTSKHAPVFLGNSPAIDNVGRFLRFGLSDLRGGLKRLVSAPKTVADIFMGKGLDPKTAGRALSFAIPAAIVAKWGKKGDPKAPSAAIDVPWGKGSSHFNLGRSDSGLALGAGMFNTFSNIGLPENSPDIRGSGALKSLPAGEGAVGSFFDALRNGDVSLGRFFGDFVPSGVGRLAALDNILAGDGPAPPSRNFFDNAARKVPVAGRWIRNATKDRGDAREDNRRNRMSGDTQGIQLLNLLLSAMGPVGQNPVHRKRIPMAPLYRR